MRDLNYRRKFNRQIAGFVITGFLLLSGGCGGSSRSQNPITMPNTPPLTPTPTPTASSGGAYMATMFLIADGSSAAPRGNVNVNAQADNGSGTLQISGGQPSTSYNLQFCSGGQPATFCTSITDYSTDASGSANVTFQVPPGQPGTFGHHVGSFYIFINGNPVYVSGANAQASGTSFRAALLTVLPQNPPPGGGSVSASGQSLHVALNGVPASMSYEVLLCSPTPGGLRCNSFGTNTVDVDAQGIGAKDFPLASPTFIGSVLVKNHLNDSFETGFRVP